MSLYFRPEKAVLGDVIPYYDNGVFKPFYLRNYRANRDEQHQDSWVMLSTTDRSPLVKDMKPHYQSTFPINR